MTIRGHSALDTQQTDRKAEIRLIVQRHTSSSYKIHCDSFIHMAYDGFIVYCWERRQTYLILIAITYKGTVWAINIRKEESLVDTFLNSISSVHD